MDSTLAQLVNAIIMLNQQVAELKRENEALITELESLKGDAAPAPLELVAE